MNADKRMIEYCRWLQEPGINCLPGSGTMGRIREEEGTNPGRRTDVQSDGGMGAMVDRMYYALQRDNRCREIAEIVKAMPPDHFHFVQCTYIGHWRDVPRVGKTAAKLMGIAVPTYWRRKAKLFAWLESALAGLVDLPERKAA